MSVSPSDRDVKRLKDFPLNEWVEAAGECPQCYSKSVQTKVTWVNESGDFGDVLLSCLICDFTIHDVAGWVLGSEPYLLYGTQYTPLTSRANVGPCVACGRLVVGGPLILFIDEGRGGQLDFDFDCAEKLGILKAMVK